MQVLENKKEIILTSKDLDNPDLSKIPSWFYIKTYGSWNTFKKSIGEPIGYTDQDLIDNYNHVKSKIGNVPYGYHMDDGSLSAITRGVYSRRFGSWNNFLESIGETIYRRHICTNKDLIDNYYDVKNKLGRKPSSLDMKKKKLSKFASVTYVSHFGSWNKFLNSIGEPIYQPSRCSKFSEKNLISNYYKVKEKLGRIPKISDMRITTHYNSISIGVYKKLFGSWNNFKKSINEPPIPYPNKISKNLCIENYYRVKSKIGNVTRRDMDNKNISEISSKTYQNKFGSWNEFKKSIGEIK